MFSIHKRNINGKIIRTISYEDSTYILNDDDRTTGYLTIMQGTTGNCKLIIMMASNIYNFASALSKALDIPVDSEESYAAIREFIASKINNTKSVLYINANNTVYTSYIKKVFKELYSETVIPIGYRSEYQYHLLIDIRKLHKGNPYVKRKTPPTPQQTQLKAILKKDYTRIAKIKEDVEKVLKM